MPSGISINYRGALAQTLLDYMQLLAVHSGDPGSDGTANLKTHTDQITSGDTIDWDETSLGSGVWTNLGDVALAADAGTFTWVSIWRDLGGTPQFQAKAPIGTPIVLSGGSGIVTIPAGELELTLAYGPLA